MGQRNGLHRAFCRCSSLALALQLVRTVPQHRQIPLPLHCPNAYNLQQGRLKCMLETCVHAAGYDDVKTIVVLGSDAALHKAQGSRSLFGADLDVIVGNNTPVVQSDVSETQAIPYSMADGALIDFSVKGMFFLLHLVYAKLCNVPVNTQAKLFCC